MLIPPSELAKKLKTSVSDVQSIVEKACIEISSGYLVPKKLSVDGPSTFTTGDIFLDQALGGGIRTGMIWELAGERFVSYKLLTW